MKYFNLLVILFISLTVHAQNPFVDWEQVQLADTEIVCAEETLEIDEHFDVPLDPEIWGTYMYYKFPGRVDDNDIYCRLQRADSECIFRDDNVTVSDGKCIITMNEALPGNNSWTAANGIGNPEITVIRDLNSGVISSKQRFRYGTFEIKSKNPSDPGAYSAFWMWHAQEIDITDIADNDSYYAASYNGDGSESDLNYSERIDDNQQDPPEDIDLTQWHNFKAVWSPYSIKWYYDDLQISESFRYYSDENTPLDLECGDVIPSGLYRINPKFLDTEKSMAVIAWLSAKPACWDEECDCDDGDGDINTTCGPQSDPEGYSEQYEIDYIKVTQTAYSEQPSLKLNDKAEYVMYSNPSQPSNFLVFGDTESSEQFDNMLEDIKNRYTSNDLSFIVIVGDILSDSNLEAYENYVSEIRTWMNETGIAVWTVPGNHDMDCQNCLTYYTEMIGDVDWMFNYNGSAFVGVLNAQQNPGWVGPGWGNEVEEYGISAATTNNVDHFLSNSNYTNLFNFTHVPLVWSNYSCGYIGYMQYYSMLVKNGLTANFAGHIHLYKKEYQCNTGAFEIVTGAASPNLVGGSGFPPNTYTSTQAYCDVRFDSWQVPHLDLYTASNTTPNSTYSLNAPYSFDMIPEQTNCDCIKARPLYNSVVKPIINLVEKDGECYTCIENTSQIYDDLIVYINGDTPLENTDLENGQLCYLLQEPNCDASVVVEYVSCESKENDCATEKVVFDPNDLEATLESMILEISECQDGDESSDSYVLLQGNNIVNIESYGITASGEIKTKEKNIENSKILISWEDFLVREIVVNLSFEYCGCLVQKEVSIAIPLCTNGDCCPPGSGFDGANCSYEIYAPQGYDPFIWQNKFYTHYGPGGKGDCPDGAIDDGAHCYYQQGIPDDYDGFVYQNNFYAKYTCDLETFLCCPAGSTWNGEYCKFDVDVPDGYTPFVIDNGLYVESDTGDCPPGTKSTEQGCYLGISVPNGLNPFTEGDNYYTEQNCDLDKCCPEGTTWNGETCIIELEWTNCNIEILDNNKIAIVYDIKDGCPQGTYANSDYTYCLTGRSVPEGYEGSVVDCNIEVVPDCQLCCPEGYLFDGKDCVKEVYLYGTEIISTPNHTYVIPDCKLFEENLDCCPEGFIFNGNNCQLSNEVEEYTIENGGYYAILKSRTVDCIKSNTWKRSSELKTMEIAKEISKMNELTLHPNPVNDQVYYEYDEDFYNLLRLSLFSSEGKLIKEINIDNESNRHIELPDTLEPGIYIIKFDFESTVISKKIIKI